MAKIWNKTRSMVGLSKTAAQARHVFDCANAWGMGDSSAARGGAPLFEFGGVSSGPPEKDLVQSRACLFVAHGPDFALKCGSPLCPMSGRVGVAAGLACAPEGAL